MVLTGVAEERVEIPEGVQVIIKDGEVVVSRGGTSLTRDLSHPRVKLSTVGREVVVRCELPRRREKALVGTYAAHVGNMIEGVTRGFTYRLKVVYSHFPMKVSVRGQEVFIENFLGEKFPRRATVRGKTRVEVKGDQVLASGPSLEDVGQTAANIEQATKIKDKDPRVFQDGIYIVSKGD
jgi:large subunit ribosomal protein L6